MKNKLIQLIEFTDIFKFSPYLLINEKKKVSSTFGKLLSFYYFIYLLFITII
jgi:hypothetical protein